LWFAFDSTRPVVRLQWRGTAARSDRCAPALNMVFCAGSRLFRRGPSMTKILLIALGGAVGATLRYVIAGWGQERFDPQGSFPVGTLIVNVLGCFAIGFLMIAAADRVPVHVRTGLLVGVLGGFTTFSTFGYETFALAGEHQPLRAAGNVILSVTLGLVAVWFGYRLAERIFGVP
jgi:CrcB protein